jgi:hypothetical protein
MSEYQDVAVIEADGARLVLEVVETSPDMPLLGSRSSSSTKNTRATIPSAQHGELQGILLAISTTT